MLADAAIHTHMRLQREPFDVLYKNFCDLLGLPRSAVHMSLDGDALALTATPQTSDLESGDLIDARVDFSQQREADMKKFVRLRLIVEGKRPEIFKIDSVRLGCRLGLAGVVADSVELFTHALVLQQHCNALSLSLCLLRRC